MPKPDDIARPDKGTCVPIRNALRAKENTFTSITFLNFTSFAEHAAKMKILNLGRWPKDAEATTCLMSWNVVLNLVKTTNIII